METNRWVFYLFFIMSFHYSKSHTLWGRSGYVSFSLKSKILHSFQAPGDHRVQPGKVPSPLGVGDGGEWAPTPMHLLMYRFWRKEGRSYRSQPVRLSGHWATRPAWKCPISCWKQNSVPPCDVRQFGPESQRIIKSESQRIIRGNQLLLSAQLLGVTAAPSPNPNLTLECQTGSGRWALPVLQRPLEVVCSKANSQPFLLLP